MLSGDQGCRGYIKWSGFGSLGHSTGTGLTSNYECFNMIIGINTVSSYLTLSGNCSIIEIRISN